MPSYQRIDRKIRGDVPASSAEVADEDAPAVEPAEDSGNGARQHVLLMAVDNVGRAQLGEHAPPKRVMALAAHVPGSAEYVNFEQPIVSLRSGSPKLSNMVGTIRPCVGRVRVHSAPRHRACRRRRTTRAPDGPRVARIAQKRYDSLWIRPHERPSKSAGPTRGSLGRLMPTSSISRSLARSSGTRPGSAMPSVVVGLRIWVSEAPDELIDRVG